MKKGNAGKKIRVTIDLSQPFYERLSEIVELVDGESKASIIRQSLQLYEYFVRRTLEGCEFQAIDKDGTPEKIVLLGGMPAK